MNDQNDRTKQKHRAAELLALTEPLERLAIRGRSPWRVSTATSVQGSFVHLDFVDMPRVGGGGSAARELEATLRRARVMGVGVVCPTALLSTHEISGVSAEDADPRAVWDGRELVLWAEPPQGLAATAPGPDADLEAARRIGGLHAFARAVADPGPAEGSPRFATSALAWQVTSRPRTGFVRVAIHAERPGAVLTARGAYAIDQQDGHVARSDGEGDWFVVEVIAAGPRRARTVFWLGDGGLDRVIATVNRRIALEAIHREASGYLER